MSKTIKHICEPLRYATILFKGELSIYRRYFYREPKWYKVYSNTEKLIKDFAELEEAYQKYKRNEQRD